MGKERLALASPTPCKLVAEESWACFSVAAGLRHLRARKEEVKVAIASVDRAQAPAAQRKRAQRAKTRKKRTAMTICLMASSAEMMLLNKRRSQQKPSTLNTLRRARSIDLVVTVTS